MKRNCKNRKLKYIREKNKLRNGGKLGFGYKVTTELLDSLEGDAFKNYINEMVDESTKKVQKKYKLIAKEGLLEMSPFGVDDDFIRNLRTVRVTLSNFKKAA